MRDTTPAILGRAELRRIVTGLAAAPEGWSDLVRHDPAQRVFECLRLDDQIEIWLICWMPGHDTGFHDHDLSSGAVVVAGVVPAWVTRWISTGENSNTSPGT